MQQAAFVAQRVLELRDEGIPLPEIAVLYRAHHHAMEIQFELARRGIPFVVRSGVRFFEAAHVKDVLAHLRFARNPGDELALKRCLRLAPGRRDRDRRGASGARSSRGGGTAPGRWTSSSRRTSPRTSRRRGAPATGASRSSCARSRGTPTCDLPGEAIEKVLEDGYEEYLRAEFLNADTRVEDVRQLAEYARGYEDTEAFLAEIALLTELSAETVSEGGEPDEKMVLSSVHQAKGLEWRAVFVVWLADGRFPSAQALKDRDGEEEERRLFYVACTRAKDELYLAYPLVAAPRDRERVVMKASRFLEELPPADPELFERWQLDEPGAGAAALAPAPAPRGSRRSATRASSRRCSARPRPGRRSAADGRAGRADDELPPVKPTPGGGGGDAAHRSVLRIRDMAGPREKPIIGIDLGTTNACVAHVRSRIPRVVPTDRGSLILPTVVALSERGDILVGGGGEGPARHEPEEHDLRGEAAHRPQVELEGRAGAAELLLVRHRRGAGRRGGGAARGQGPHAPRDQRDGPRAHQEDRGGVPPEEDRRGDHLGAGLLLGRAAARGAAGGQARRAST